MAGCGDRRRLGRRATAGPAEQSSVQRAQGRDWAGSRGKTGQHSGWIRMVPDFKRTMMLDLVKQHVTPGSTVCNDGLKGFEGVHAAGIRHVPVRNRAGATCAKAPPSVVPLADRTIGN